MKVFTTIWFPFSCTVTIIALLSVMIYNNVMLFDLFRGLSGRIGNG